MCKERAKATRTSEHQLQSIMSELRALKEKHEKDTKERKVDEKTLLENIKASIDPILKSDHKTSDHIGVGARLKHLQEEVTNYLPPTLNKKWGAAVTTDDTFGDLTLGGYRDAKHVHLASTPIRLEISDINLTTPPCTHKEETIVESVLHNTMRTLASEFKRMCEPKIQKFRGGTSSGALLVFKSWMQDIKCAIKDLNLNNNEALQLIKEFSEGCARDNINFNLEVTDKPSVDGLFENLRQVFLSGEDGQQMLAEFYSRVQNPKESVKEFGESILQIARKIMMAKPEFKVDINNTLKAHFADSLRDHYHQAMAREMIHSRPTLSYVAFKSEVLKTFGPNVKPCSITTSKLEISDIESPPKKRKCESEFDQKINAAIEENRKLSERLSAFDPKTITDTVINAVQGNYPSSKPAGFTSKQFKPSQFYGKPREPQLVPGTETVDQMLDRIELVFSRLKEFNLKIKPKKSHLFQTSVTFLGHIISADSVSPNLEKVAKIKDWPTPKTPKEVHSFVGLALYYRRFIPNFAKWAGPLHALIVPASFKQKIRKGEMRKSDLPEFQWTPACQEGFDQLKKALTEAPVLAYPDYSKPFILETDASLKGLGMVLSQKGDDNEIHVIAYAS